MAEREQAWFREVRPEYGPPTDLRPEVPHPARIYDFLLGGKDHFPADRAAGEQLLAADPTLRQVARANRMFLQRAVRTLAVAGVRQFLDIGTGLPAAGNTHEVAQQIDPQASVVYVDNDPIVLTHARALMSGPGQGATAIVHADLRDPDAILRDPRTRELLDLERPVGLLMVGLLHFVRDADDPYGAVAHLMAALPSGSHLAFTHGTGDFIDPDAGARAVEAYAHSTAPVTGRTRSEVERFLTGLELLPPGLVPLDQWRPEAPSTSRDTPMPVYAAVARKP